MTRGLRQIPEFSGVDARRFREEILPQAMPAVLRGLAARWPAVAEGRKSPQAFCDYVRRFDKGSTVTTYIGDSTIGGRFWYQPDMSGLNFERKSEPLPAAMARILATLDQPVPPAVYAGSIPIQECLPGFVNDNAMDLVDGNLVPQFWIGTRCTVSTHQDLSDNIACVATGRRRFTLFPPEQLPNLYVGPLEFNFAGQPVSMVSLDDPDFERYPRFKEALAAAQEAELEPGDAVFIPYMWWHNVESLEPFNVLVNFRWYDEARRLGSPFEAMVHGVLAIAELPPERRELWRKVFDHYVFRKERHPVEHLAPEHRGVLGAPTPELARTIKAWLIRCLSR